jgi:cytochrome c2
MRMPRAAGLAALFAASSPTLGLAQSNGAFTGDPAEGRTIFVERGCIDCHSIWGNGGSLGPDFAVVGAGRSLQQLAGLFWNHTPRMIETVRTRAIDWPTFSEEELADIISYVYYVKLFDEPGDPESGERWFREKRCVACHAIGGNGGEVGPALDAYARYIAPIALAAGLWNSGPAMRSAQQVHGIAMPVFVDRELSDIHAYLRAASDLHPREPVFLEPPDPNVGRELFTRSGCPRCHGADGGGTSLAPDLRTATQRLHVSEIAGQLWNHSFQMTTAMRSLGMAFPRFDTTEMADLISFLYYLRFYESEGDPVAGEAVFVEKRCAGCHGGDGESGVGPGLVDSEAVLTPLGLATAMWNHAPAMYDLIQWQEWPRFEGEEMRDLSVYLKTLATSPP